MKCLDYWDIYNEYMQNYLEDCNLFRQCNDVIDGKDEMIIYDYFVLNYTVSIASQSLIFLYKDLYQRVINDRHSTIYTYTLIPTCWCIFPMKCKTLILIFGLADSRRRYSKFFRNYRKLSKLEKLKLIQMITFLYDENVFFSEKLKNIMQKDVNFVNKIAKHDFLKMDIEKNFPDIATYNDFNCYLDEQYSVQRLNRE